MLISLERIKLHLRLDCSEADTEANQELRRMYAAAVDYVCNFTNSNVSRLTEPDAPCFKPSVEQAILLLIGEFYANREALGLNYAMHRHQTTTTVERLLHFHRQCLGV